MCRLDKYVFDHRHYVLQFFLYFAVVFPKTISWFKNKLFNPLNTIQMPISRISVLNIILQRRTQQKLGKK